MKETHYQVECTVCKEKFFVSAEDMFEIEIHDQIVFDLTRCPKCEKLQSVDILVMR